MMMFRARIQRVGTAPLNIVYTYSTMYKLHMERKLASILEAAQFLGVTPDDPASMGARGTALTGCTDSRRGSAL